MSSYVLKIDVPLRVDTSGLAQIKTEVGRLSQLIKGNLSKDIGKVVGGFHTSANAIQKLNADLSKTSELTKKIGSDAGKIKISSPAQAQGGDGGGQSTSSMPSLGVVGGLASAYLGTSLVKNAYQLGQEVRSANASLKIMVGNTENVLEVQEKVRQSADRTMSSYSDTARAVADIKAQTGGLFDNTDETIKFVETMNKGMRAYGMNAENAKIASMQISQAMSRGYMDRGDFKSIMNQGGAGLIQQLQKQMGVSAGTFDQMISDGEVTAEFLKKAFLGSADVIEERFKQVPLTASDAFNVFVNGVSQKIAQMTEIIDGSFLTPLMGGFLSIGEIVVNLLSDVVSTFSEIGATINDTFGGNVTGGFLETVGQIVGVITALGVAVGVTMGIMKVFTTVKAIYTTVTSAATLAAMGFNLATGGILLAVGAVVVGLSYLIQSCGGLANAWEYTKAAAINTWTAITNFSIGCVNALIDGYNLIVDAVEGVLNGFVKFINLYIDYCQIWVNAVLGGINLLIDGFNKVKQLSNEKMGTNFTTTEHVRFDLSPAKVGAVSLQGAKARKVGYYTYTNPNINPKTAEEKINSTNKEENGGEDSKVGKDSNKKLGKIAKNTEKTKDAIDDLKALYDLKEREVLMGRTQPNITISMPITNHNNGENSGINERNILKGLEKVLRNNMIANAEG